MFHTTTQHTQSTPLPSHPSTHASTLALLHNASVMITLNPLVKAHSLLSSLLPPTTSSTSAISLPESPAEVLIESKKEEVRGGIKEGLDGADGRMMLGGEYTYEITDQVPTLPFHLWDTTVVYAANFWPKAEGLDTFVHAPAGTTIKTNWRIVSSAPSPSSPASVPRADSKDDDEDVGIAEENGEVRQAGEERANDEEAFILEERAEVDCHLALLPIIRAQMHSSHASLHESFVSRLRETFPPIS